MFVFFFIVKIDVRSSKHDFLLRALFIGGGIDVTFK